MDYYRWSEGRNAARKRRKKSHFGKLISIGNKSLQTAEGKGEGAWRAERERERERERAEVSRN